MGIDKNFSQQGSAPEKNEGEKMEIITQDDILVLAWSLKTKDDLDNLLDRITRGDIRVKGENQFLDKDERDELMRDILKTTNIDNYKKKEAEKEAAELPSMKPDDKENKLEKEQPELIDEKKPLSEEEKNEDNALLNEGEVEDLAFKLIKDINIDPQEKNIIRKQIEEDLKNLNIHKNSLAKNGLDEALKNIVVNPIINRFNKEKGLNKKNPLNKKEKKEYILDIIDRAEAGLELGGKPKLENWEWEYINKIAKEKIDNLLISENEKKDQVSREKIIAAITTAVLDNYDKFVINKIIKNSGLEINDGEERVGEIKTEKPEEKPIEPEPTPEATVEKEKTPEEILGEKRTAYAEAYKNFDKKKYKKFVGDNTLSVKKINIAFEEARILLLSEEAKEERRLNFIEKLKEAGLTEEIAEQAYGEEAAKLDYNNEKQKFGKIFKAEKEEEIKKELEKKYNSKYEDWKEGGEEKKELEEKLQLELFQKLIVNEHNILTKEKIENLPPKEKDIINEMFDKWIKLSPTKRLLISTAIATAIVGSTGVGWTAPLAKYGAMRLGKGAGAVLAGKGVGATFKKGFDLLTGKKFEKSQKEKESKLIEEIDISNLEKSETGFKKIKKERESRERKKNIGALIASVIAGGATAAAMGHLEHTHAGNGGAKILPEEALRKPTAPEQYTTIKPITPEELSDESAALAKEKINIAAEKEPQSSYDTTSQSEEITAPIMGDNVPPNCEVKISPEVEAIMKDRNIIFKNGTIDIGNGRKLNFSGIGEDKGVTQSIEILKKGNDLEVIVTDADGTIDKVLLDANNEIIDQLGLETRHVAPENQQISASAEATAVETSTPEIQLTKQLEISTIKRGEGIEHAFKRQLIDKPESFGYNKASGLTPEKWAEGEAHRIAIKAGYVDMETGREIRVGTKGIDKTAYVLKQDGEGNLGVKEYFKNKDGNFENTETHEVVKKYSEAQFEGDQKDSYEYIPPKESAPQSVEHLQKTITPEIVKGARPEGLPIREQTAEIPTAKSEINFSELDPQETRKVITDKLFEEYRMNSGDYDQISHLRPGEFYQLSSAQDAANHGFTEHFKLQNVNELQEKVKEVYKTLSPEEKQMSVEELIKKNYKKFFPGEKIGPGTKLAENAIDAQKDGLHNLGEINRVEGEIKNFSKFLAPEMRQHINSTPLEARGDDFYKQIEAEINKIDRLKIVEDTAQNKINLSLIDNGEKIVKDFNLPEGWKVIEQHGNDPKNVSIDLKTDTGKTISGELKLDRQKNIILDNFIKKEKLEDVINRGGGNLLRPNMVDIDLSKIHKGKMVDVDLDAVKK